MPRKNYKPEEIIAKLRQVEVLTSQDKAAVDAIRSIGVTDATYYRWYQEYGGLKAYQVKRMKELEVENTRLREEFLNGEIFCILQEARVLIEAWRPQYSTIRPHSSLGYRPPAPEVLIWPAPQPVFNNAASFKSDTVQSHRINYI